MTLKEFIAKASKNEQFQLTINEDTIPGHYNASELEDMYDTENMIVHRWFSLADPYYKDSYTFVDVREVRYEEV